MSARNAAAPENASFELSPDDLRRICDLLYRRTGIVFGEAKRYFLERRLFDRMMRTGSPSVPSYLGLLRRDDSEIELFINSITVNETYFYRELYQLRCLGLALLPAIVASRGPGDLVRIWSVPCATGEEPYSIALWLLENWGLVDAYHIEIVGSDIATDALERAKAGFYSERATARLPPAMLAEYFEPPQEGSRRIIADLRESVTFTKVNLVDAQSMADHGAFDVIFCRNVLIYFDEEARLAAARHLHAALNPGGFICLGHTESFTHLSEMFEPRRFDDALVFQRPVAA